MALSQPFNLTFNVGRLNIKMATLIIFILLLLFTLSFLFSHKKIFSEHHDIIILR